MHEAMLAHLGMSGQMLVGEPDRPLSPHVRARFTFTDGGPDLRFTDQRTFGHLMLVESGSASGGWGSHGWCRCRSRTLPPDPLDGGFEPDRQLRPAAAPVRRGIPGSSARCSTSP